MQITPLTPTIGAELSGIDLTRQLDDATVAAIRQALLDHQVIFMRDQPLDPDGLAAFAERFGPLYVQPDGWSQYVVPHVMTVHMDGDTKVHAGPQWHSDLSCAEHPPMGSILHNHQIPESGGDTLFANMAAAFAALSLPLRRWLETLTAVHSYVYDDGSWPEVRAEHPAITTHPETGAKVLYVNRSYTSHIKELEPAESRSLLAFLYRLTEQPRFQCRFRRSANALAFWDNRAAQHMALWDYRPAVRSGHRVDIGQAQ